MPNLFANLPRSLPAEQFDVLVAAGRLRLERIVSTSHATRPERWEDQNTDEWVVVLRGRAGLRFEGADNVVVLREGDHLIISAHRRHRVEWTDPDQATVWLALHYFVGGGLDGPLRDLPRTRCAGAAGARREQALNSPSPERRARQGRARSRPNVR